MKKALLLLLSAITLSCFAKERLLDSEESIKAGAPLSAFAHLKGHPLYPYLQYRAYRETLNATSPALIAHFLHENPTAPFSGWLAERAFPQWLAGGQYQAIIDAYDPRLADESIECEYRLAQLAVGNSKAAFNDINSIWLKPSSIESACDPLFLHALSKGKLRPEDLRARFILAMNAGNHSIARHITSMMQGADANVANVWLTLITRNDPYQLALTIDNPFWQQTALANALSRQAFKDTNQVAALALDIYQPGVGDQAVEADLFNRLTRALGNNDDPRLVQAWTRIPRDLRDDNSTYDVIAYFLRHHDWQNLAALLEAGFNNNERNPEINYWLGKAYEKLGNNQKSKQYYSEAAAKRDFFGFLAAEKLGQDYAFNDHSITADASIQQQLLGEPASYRMRIFRNLGMDSRALQEWRSLLKNKTATEIRQAVLLADQFGWHIHAISTLAKEKDWDALNVRFPTDYESRVRALALKHGVSPATIYAIIRKESIFQPTIKSPAGALGLMQVMPATARDTARRYNIPYGGTNQLTDVDTNLAIGSQYLADRLREFGHLGYAAAAYNAGPHRAHRWLTEHAGLPLDEWIAQIPFNETRDYVKRVLEYEKVYQYRLGLNYTPYASATVRAW